MNFWQTIKDSAYNPGFYRGARDHALGKVIGYYAKLSLVLGLAALVFTAITVSPKVAKGVREAGDNTLSIYPSDLVVQINKGVVSTNASTTEPVVIPTPEFLTREMSDKGARQFPANIVTIDTRSTTTISFEEFKDMNTLVFVGRTYIISHDDHGAIAYRDLSKAPDATVNRALIEKILGFASVLWIILPIMLFVGVFVGSFITLIYIALLTLVTLLISRITGRKFSYSQSFKVTAYAATWPAIVLLALAPLAMNVPFLFSLLTLIVVLLNLPPKEEIVAPEL